ncbi:MULTISPECIES: hypothetical protein [unclassified Methylobacterium]|jgi:hypothetical protein|uniref:hypothetical protein n=1 Tax=unclassified Methylobacterium TaxID=2615210 RepID=UPI0011C200FA|nr:MULTISPECIES: hypothetical protein [unclassified Methylobacterium]QEE38694.1 hypothetical protein FVA80_06605 [Methylobacterium sp. WL1]TXN02279.1 hypothetical protein FV242_15620 [Methylobacterium sp. WL64]TXN52583.1 hypothetical protein FV241_29320 [Methylobacterium sp. WL2]
MSVAILVALIAGALCLGMLSSILPSGRRDEDEELACENDYFDIGGPVIDLKPLIPLIEAPALEAKR